MKIFPYLLLPMILLAACSTSSSNVVFRDDFDGELAEGWEMINEDATRWEITEEGWLSITADNPTLKDHRAN